MVKELVNSTVVPAPFPKPLAGAVYKRQRKQLSASALSRGTGTPQRNSRFAAKPAVTATTRSEATSSGTKEKTCRLPTTKSTHASASNRMQALGRSTERAQGTSKTTASQSLHDIAPLSTQNHQKLQAPQQQPRQTWGLTQEADYFAQLDAEELIEDGQEDAGALACSQPAVTDQRQQSGASQIQGSAQPSKQKGTASDSNHVQTPDAIALAKYHPDLQADYLDYVQCMGSSQSALTPMLLEDFCRLVGKQARGLPVFNT